MHDLHTVALTGSQEPNYLHIHERHFLQVQNELGSVLQKLFLQFPNMLRLKVTNQANRSLSVVRLLFDPQSPTRLRRSIGAEG
jgi:hypothetical protein